MSRWIVGTLGVVVGLAVAFASVALLVWLLKRLWEREEQGTADNSVLELELPQRAPVARPSHAPPQAEGGDRGAEVRLEEAQAPPAPDDLKKIEGIGPKIASVLQDAGITTFAQLADTAAERLERILEAADPRLVRLASPDSWPEQAALAADGEWDALEALQNRLKGGRRA